MLKFFRRRPRRPRRSRPRELEAYRAYVSVADTNPELRIRDLRDDPRIRGALGLDEVPTIHIFDGAA